MPIGFLRDIYKGNLSLKIADEEQSNLFNISKSLNEGVNPVEKRSLLNNIGLFLNNFRSKIFPVKKYKNTAST